MKQLLTNLSYSTLLAYIMASCQGSFSSNMNNQKGHGDNINKASTSTSSAENVQGFENIGVTPFNVEKELFDRVFIKFKKLNSRLIGQKSFRELEEEIVNIIYFNRQIFKKLKKHYVFNAFNKGSGLSYPNPSSKYYQWLKLFYLDIKDSYTYEMFDRNRVNQSFHSFDQTADLKTLMELLSICHMPELLRCIEKYRNAFSESTSACPIADKSNTSVLTWILSTIRADLDPCNAIEEKYKTINTSIVTSFYRCFRHKRSEWVKEKLRGSRRERRCFMIQVLDEIASIKINKLKIPTEDLPHQVKLALEDPFDSLIAAVKSKEFIEVFKLNIDEYFVDHMLGILYSIIYYNYDAYIEPTDADHQLNNYMNQGILSFCKAVLEQIDHLGKLDPTTDDFTSLVNIAEEKKVSEIQALLESYPKKSIT